MEGEFFVIFDVDFCFCFDFFKEFVVEYMVDFKMVIIQSLQFFRVIDDQIWVEQGVGVMQELFYCVVQVNWNKWGVLICVGSNVVYRREVLVEVGGMVEIGFLEDVYIG